uniref:Plakophilin-2 n=1 Tax=Fundulus heteroclitus TaxID=8078 RepID=A0A3Q2QWW4_FUNHE
MDGNILNSKLLDSQAQADTSLALPRPASAESSLRSESTGRTRRVQEQVRLTLQNSKKGRSNSNKAEYGGLDDADGDNSNTKVNGSEYRRLHLEDSRSQRRYRQADASPTPCQKSSPDLSNYPISLRALLPVSEQHMNWVGALLDTHNPAQQHTLSKFRGTVPRPFMSRPGISPRQSVRAKSLSGSPAVLQSPGNTWSHSVVKYHKQTVQRGVNRVPVSTHLDGGPTAAGFRRLTESKRDGQQKSLPVVRAAKKPPKMTMAVALCNLTQNNEEVLIRAARYIQRECLHGFEARTKVYNCNGIQSLLLLLQYDNEEVQCAAAGALRNVVYTHNENKTVLKTNDNLTKILEALQNSRHKETIVELAGLLWNLSSDDTIKELFSSRFLRIITKSILVPSSSLHAADNPKDEMIADPRAFCCATGCLRNLSSAGPNVRKDMRKCEELIDSLAYYIQGTVASGSPNDESTEHCACILQNLTYEAEFDYTSQTTEKHQEPEQDVAPKKTTVGCLNIFSAKPMKNVEAENDAENRRLLLVGKDPQGANWLWSNAAVRLYLALVALSKKKSTRQAGLGALQNLTARKEKISEFVALTIVEITENLQKIKVLLDEDSLLQEQTICLIKNLCNYPQHHDVIFNTLLPVLKMLHCKPGEGTKEIVFHILAKLSLNNVTKARYIIKDEAVQSMLSDDQEGKAENAANNLRCILWNLKDLHKDLREFNIAKPLKKTKGQ